MRVPRTPVYLPFSLVIFIVLIGCRGLPWDIADKDLGLPQPRYRVAIERNIRIPMRDGVGLAADIYRPEPPGEYPTLLVRTPYDKLNPVYGLTILGGAFASQGYVVIVQDVRGKFNSQGEFYPLVNEAEDGGDTINWIIGQPWSNGRVGMFGVSYFASTEWLAAPSSGAALQTIVPIFTSQSGYDSWFNRGVLNLSMTVAWHYQNDGPKMRTMTPAKWERGIHALPLVEADAAMGFTNPIYGDWLSHTVPGPFWGPMSVDDRESEITQPVLFVAGWYDPFLPYMLEDYTRIRETGGSENARKSRIIIGPWTHTTESQFRDFKTGTAGHFTAQLAEILRWYDRWLKDDYNGSDEAGPITLFVMGKDVWRREAAWPLERTVYTDYFLHSDGSANGADGNGALSREGPGEEPEDTFVYDPEHPVPTIGMDAEHTISPGPSEQFQVESRQDVLVYTGDMLTEALEITGPVRLVLHVKSSAPDTDFTAKLIDLRPDGIPIDLCSGIVRTRFRNSPDQPDFLEPDRVYRLEISLGATSFVFSRGHRIRLYVSSSDFPRHDRNLNTRELIGFGTEMEKAFQTVYHDALYPSHLVLPVIPVPGD